MLGDGCQLGRRAGGAQPAGSQGRWARGNKWEGKKEWEGGREASSLLEAVARNEAFRVGTEPSSVSRCLTCEVRTRGPLSRSR